eukprot:gene4649-14983_t
MNADAPPPPPPDYPSPPRTPKDEPKRREIEIHEDELPMNKDEEMEIGKDIIDTTVITTSSASSTLLRHEVGRALDVVMTVVCLAPLQSWLDSLDR